VKFYGNRHEGILEYIFFEFLSGGCIHSVLTHPNIVKFYGNRHEGILEYIFFEFLSEGCIHRVLTHPNIEQFYGNRREGILEYIFLELLSGGDLFIAQLVSILHNQQLKDCYQYMLCEKS
jgi:serine/threonine protein kinase